MVLVQLKASKNKHFGYKTIKGLQGTMDDYNLLQLLLQ